MKIALTSVSDIKNYGDLLFPFIARQEIQKRIPGAKFRFFTPTSDVIEEQEFIEYSRKNIEEYAPDVILTIGGEVIHKYDDLVWQDMYHGKVAKPSNVIFDWLDYPAKYKAWFSVGVLDLGDPKIPVSDEEIQKLNYIGVRGVLSKKIMEHGLFLNTNPSINIVPDIGWIFPRYFKDYKRTLKHIAKSQHVDLKPNNYFVFNINWTSIPEQKILEILNILADFQKQTHLKLVILDVISSYKRLSVNIPQYFKDNKEVICLAGLKLKETGALLMGNRFFIGSSLHCAITTLANGKPAAVMHRTKLTKLQDLFGHMMMTDFVSYDWDDLSELLQKLYDFKSTAVLKKYVAFMQACFDNKLDELVQKIISVCNINKPKIISSVWNYIYKRPLKHIRRFLAKISFIPTKAKLLVVDNFEPSFLQTGFRVKEFIWLLKNAPDCKLLTFSSDIMVYNDWMKRQKTKQIIWSTPQPSKIYKKHVMQYAKKFNVDKKRFLFLRCKKYKADGAYLMFLYNAYLSKNFLEKNKIPFVFTLFPGGGLRLDHEFSDFMLQSVFSSPMFRGVFVPQKVIYDYLIQKNLCPKDKIYFSYGGGFFQFTKTDVLPKQWYKKDKSTFDISFVAYKYMNQGLDKGFDLVIHAAKELVKKYPFVHFHCVGTNTLDDFDEDFSDIADNLHFYGSRTSDFFPSFYAKMDMALSPNRPNMLDKGSFDGFPLSVEAMWFGVPLFCTDELKLNHNYDAGKDLVIIHPDLQDITEKIETFIKKPDLLQQIGTRGQQTVQHYFDINKQQSDRAKFINKYLNIKID